MKLYELRAEYQALQAAAEDGEDIAEALSVLTDELEVKAENIARILRNMESDEDALAAEYARLSERKKSLSMQHEKLREYLRANMEACGITKIKTAAFTITLANNPERVDVVDASAVPPEYMRTRTEVAVDKQGVLRAWRDHGECVPGTTVTRSTSVRIK